MKRYLDIGRKADAIDFAAVFVKFAATISYVVFSPVHDVFVVLWVLSLLSSLPAQMRIYRPLFHQEPHFYEQCSECDGYGSIPIGVGAESPQHDGCGSCGGTGQTEVEAVSKTGSMIGQTFTCSPLLCPVCQQDSVIGYLLTNERSEHMHTHYVCTFWKSGETRRCGWSGWIVPGWDKD